LAGSRTERKYRASGGKPEGKATSLGVISDLWVNLSPIFHEIEGQLPIISLQAGRSLATRGNRPDKTENKQGACEEDGTRRQRPEHEKLLSGLYKVKELKESMSPGDMYPHARTRGEVSLTAGSQKFIPASIFQQ
jgi:hypothetical protein